MNNLKKQQIALEVIKVLKIRFDKFPKDIQNNRNAPFHEAFLKAFKSKIENYIDNVPLFISLASWLHGLNTTLGQSFFENVAHILSNGEKRTFKECKYFEEQEKIINEIITDLKNGNKQPNLEEENKLIFSIKNGKLKKAPNFTADVFILEKDYIEAIELKSVRPNAGEMRGEKEKILKAKACLKYLYPDKDIRYFIGFPFDPLCKTPTGYNKNRFMEHLVEFKKYFSPEEVLLAAELWDRLAKENKTMEKILEIINKIASPEFIRKYYFINNPENYRKDPQKYEQILKDWYLFDELLIIKKFEYLERIAYRILYSQLFDLKGNYNWKRINYLKNLIK